MVLELRYTEQYYKKIQLKQWNKHLMQTAKSAEEKIRHAETII